jgi:putative PIN family toxin of toxin-antitoxin system
MRVVFDTNIFISAFEFGGVPRAALLLASAGWFELCSSGALLAELERVLRDRFEYSEEMLGEIGIRLHGLCMVVEPTEEIAACGDSEDNRVLECAVAGNAEAIVSGDRALLRLDPFRGIRILSPARFLDEKPWSIRGED